MRTSWKLMGTVAGVALAAGVGSLSAVARQPGGEAGAPLIGPDVIVGSIYNTNNYGTSGGIVGYSIGTVSCNIGDHWLLWCDAANPAVPCEKNQHPVIAQNLYRLKGGRLEQIGMSWLKHGFCALAQTLCGPCSLDLYGCDTLDVGCSDPYHALLNGAQGYLGPRSQVNPSTGIFPYPFTAPAVQDSKIDRRIRVKLEDVDPALNPGALYFAEAQYVAADDAAAANHFNNTSYRRVAIGDPGSGAWALVLVDATMQQKCAIEAWQDHGLGIGLKDPAVSLQTQAIEDGGRFVAACRVSDNGDGTWHYEYAIYNQNADRAARSWSVPLPDGVTATNIGQHLVNHHSGEPYSTAAWAASVANGAITWSTDDFATNANANALRWGTMFNFRFDADAPPQTGSPALALFKPGAAADPTFTLPVPAPPFEPCDGDLDGDGLVNGGDLGSLLGQWGACPGCLGDLNDDGSVDGDDLGALLGAWGPC